VPRAVRCLILRITAARACLTGMVSTTRRRSPRVLAWISPPRKSSAACGPAARRSRRGALRPRTWCRARARRSRRLMPSTGLCRAWPICPGQRGSRARLGGIIREARGCSLTALVRSGCGLVRHGKWSDHSIVDGNHPCLPAPRRFRLTVHANEASEGPGEQAAVLGQSAGSSHPRGAEIMPIDPGRSALWSGRHRHGRHNPVLGKSGLMPSAA
jgi:hypothetical protein